MGWVWGGFADEAVWVYKVLELEVLFMGLQVYREGDPWVVQRFRACLWPRARSWSPGIESRDRVPRQTPGMEPASPSSCVSTSLFLSFSLYVYHK